MITSSFIQVPFDAFRVAVNLTVAVVVSISSQKEDKIKAKKIVHDVVCGLSHQHSRQFFCHRFQHSRRYVCRGFVCQPISRGWNDTVYETMTCPPFPFTSM